jgi:hypothetical protein
MNSKRPIYFNPDNPTAKRVWGIPQTGRLSQTEQKKVSIWGRATHYVSAHSVVK